MPYSVKGFTYITEYGTNLSDYYFMYNIYFLNGAREALAKTITKSDFDVCKLKIRQKH